ncbi:MAG: CDP-archaeol synthase [Alphaproteobacteria bacterium]|nr:CDP-archaeol synthase [Alphaproteobacteria bacterium]
MLSPDLPALIFLVLLANGTPLIVQKVLGHRYSQPIDGDCRFIDGWPLLGQAKTLRGVACAIVVTTAAAPVVGLGWKIGLLVGSLAMVGDLFSSFVKRRLGRTSSSPIIGIDQIPESLFPLLACTGPLSLTITNVAIGVAIFFVGELLVSRLLYAFDLRDPPY